MDDSVRERALLDVVTLSRLGADRPQTVGSKKARRPPSVLCAFDLEAAGSTSTALRNVFVHDACKRGWFSAEDYASAFDGAPPDELIVPRLLHDFLAAVDAKVGPRGHGAPRVRELCARCAGRARTWSCSD